MLLRLPDIFAAHGGPSKLAHALGLPVQNVHRWKQRSSIPAKYWAAIASLGTVSAGTLAAAHAPEEAACYPAVATVVQNV